jgi:hypothetical protein
MMMLRNIPYTIIPLILFNVVILFADPNVWADTIFTVTLFSGAAWSLHWGELMVFLGLLALLGEVFRSTSAARGAVANHLMSIIVLVVYVIEFVVVADAANSTFFNLMIIALIDVLTGVVVAIRMATRDIAFQDVHHN